MNAIDPEKLGDRLRKLRKARGLTQTEIGAKLGVSKQQANHWEQGRSALTLEHLIKLARLYEIGVGEILSEQTVSNIAPAPHVAGTPVPLYSEPELQDIVAEHTSHKRAEMLIFAKSRCSPEAVAFHVFDRAMSPLFIPNDLVIVDPLVRPEPGDCVAVALQEDRRILFRRFRPASEAQRVEPPYTLRAENPDYEPRTILNDSRPKFLGTLVEHTRFGPRG